MQSSGKIAQCAPAVGAKMVCLSVTLRVRCIVSSRGAQFEQALRCRLQADFDKIFAIFSEGIVLSHAIHSSHFCWQMTPHIPRNGGQKLRKFKKSAEKFVRTRQLRVLKKNSNAVVQGRECRCALYNFFPHVAIQCRQQESKFVLIVHFCKSDTTSFIKSNYEPFYLFNNGTTSRWNCHY